MCQMVVAAWLVALSALWFPNETGSFACVCEVQSGQLVPLPVRNSVEVVAVCSMFICLNHQQTIVKSALGKGISCRSALATIVFNLSLLHNHVDYHPLP